MNRLVWLNRRVCLTFVIGLMACADAQAQGLIWSLPEDGSWVRYEGTYTQEEVRPDATGNLILQWVRHLTIKSVGRAQADYRGQMVDCRWIEIKLQTGRILDGRVDTGSVGERIYKILVPEPRVLGRLQDEEGLPVSYLPIVRGFRKTNDKDPTPREIKTGILQVFPIISLIRHYKSMDASDVPASVAVGLNDYPTTVLTGSVVQESRTTRVTHETKEMHRNDEFPFGLVQWKIEIVEDRKGEVLPRSEFAFASKIEVEMTARETGTDATSELAVE